MIGKTSLPDLPERCWLGSTRDHALYSWPLFLQHSCRYIIDGWCDREIHGGKRDDASLPDRLFQGLKGLKMASGIFSRTCRFFYFYRIECAVLMNEQIDLFGVFVAIVVNGGTLAVVPPAFDVLRYHPAFKNGSWHRSRFQRFGWSPLVQPGCKSRIEEVQFRSFHHSFVDISVPWLEQVDDAWVFKNREPSFSCRMVDVALAAKVQDIEHLAGACRTGAEKSQECAFAADIGKIPHIMLQIGLEVWVVSARDFRVLLPSYWITGMIPAFSGCLWQLLWQCRLWFFEPAR